MMQHRKPLFNARAASFDVRAAASSIEIDLYTEIGGAGVYASDFRKVLAGLDGRNTIKLRINSPGGDVFEGIAIYEDLRASRAKVVVSVAGLAASAASIVAMAGSRITMAQNAFLMIHNAWALAIGDAPAMEAMAGTLRKIDARLAAIYAGRTGKDAEEMAAAMAAETWFDAEDALNAGLSDEIDGADVPEIAAAFDLSSYRNTPSLLKKFAAKAADVAPAAAPDCEIIAALQRLGATIKGV
jgi:ATP-dependent Clp protease, protease subunit